MKRIVEIIGGKSLDFCEAAGRMGLFLGRTFLCLTSRPFKFRPALRQVQFIGSMSTFVILFTGAFTGMVLALQGYYSLRKFGSEGYLGAAVALSLIRELGPVLTALMVVGRVGSAICAEIGIMRNSEQIDALECMAIDPVRFLIVPKLLAGIISLPLLTAVFDVVGIWGGYLVGVDLFGIESGAYFQRMYSSVEWTDINMGLVKSVIFAVLIVWICAYKGYYLHLSHSGGFGAEGVSRATTEAVVFASVSILVWDYFVSSLLL